MWKPENGGSRPGSIGFSVSLFKVPGLGAWLGKFLGGGIAEVKMKSATLTRDKKKSGPAGTYGLWVSGTGFKSVTMERPPTGPHPCIPLPPTGAYLCELAVSPCFYAHNADFGYGRGVVYHVRKVPGREHILIHPANWPVEIKTAKKEKHLQIEGCIAPGAAVTKVQVPEPDGRVLPGITSSVFATKALMADMRGEPFMLTILEA